MTLRGIAWGDSLLPSLPSCAADLAARSAELLRSLGRFLRDLLPSLDAQLPSRVMGDEACAPITHTLTLAEAQYGVTLFLGDALVIIDEGPIPGTPAADGDPAVDTVWLPHITRAELTEQHTITTSGIANAKLPPLAASARWLYDGGGTTNVGPACPGVVVEGTEIGNALLWMYGVRGADAAAAGATPFSPAPPPSEMVFVSRCVPVCVCARTISPTLRAIIDATDPRLADSAAVSTVRLLTTLISASSDSSASSFARVSRELAAVLQFNDAAAPPGAGDKDNGGGGGSAGAAAANEQIGFSSSHDADTLAALISALEEADAQLPISLGGTTGDDKQEKDGLLLGAAGVRMAAQNIKWVSHLARHPYLAGYVHDDEAVLNDFLVYTAPLRLAQKRNAAALIAELGTEGGVATGLGGTS